jgi:RHS repeat-associated protein
VAPPSAARLLAAVTSGPIPSRLSAAPAVSARDAAGALSSPQPPPENEVVEYYHVDALGSVRVVTDGAGQLLRHHDFLPFGEEWQPQTPSPDQRLFTGKERDVETGLDYFGARYYRADLGRFTTVDPVGVSPLHLVNPQRFNSYSYGVGNPLTFIDPDGRDAIVVNYSQGGGGYGHQGVVVVRSDGSATSSDYGPLKPGGERVQPGVVNTTRLATRVTFDSRGLPTSESLENLARDLEKPEEAPAGSVRLAYFRTSAVETAALVNWIADMNENSKARGYATWRAFGNNCRRGCPPGDRGVPRVDRRRASTRPPRSS